MAGTTSNYAFPYPTGTDSINTGDTKIQELADSLDAFISGSEASGKLFNHVGTTDTTNRTTTNCSTTEKNVTGASTTTITVGKSGFFAVIGTVNAVNNTTASNGWVYGLKVTGSVSGTIDTVALANSAVSTTARSGGSFINFYDSANAGETITIQPQVRVVQTGTADTIIVYQSTVQVVTFG